MPRNAGKVESIEKLSAEDRKKEPGHSQEHWYVLAGAYCGNLTVLDVGAGTGSGLLVLRSMGAKEALGIDPLPVGSEVLPIDVSLFRDNSLDIVTCFDVIEHVEDDIAFLSHLLRVCRYGVFLSTPNWDVWHCANKYHVREYTPAEMEVLLKGKQYVCWTAGANRVTNPVHSCILADTQAAYCIAIRGNACTDEHWLNLQEGAGAAAANVPARLSHYGKWSEEWNAELKNLFNTGTTPLDGLAKVANWVNGMVRLGDRSLVPAGHAYPVMDVLRYGSGTRLEQFATIGWIAETIATLK